MAGLLRDFRVLPGTRKANAPLVPDSDGTIDALDIDALSIGGTAIAATAAEINKLASSGTVVASGTPVSHIADVGGTATGTDATIIGNLQTAVGAIIDALEAFGIDPGA